MLTMSSALDRCLRLYGGRRAIVDAEGTWSWAEHLARVARAAAVLAARGVKPGQRFGILSRNLFRHAELLHAGYWMGAVPVPVNIRLAAPEIAFILADADVKALAVDEPFLPLTAHEQIAPFAKNAFAVSPKPLGGALPDYETLLKAADPHPRFESKEDDDAMLLYTGGTTGRSKGVRLTHREHRLERHRSSRLAIGARQRADILAHRRRCSTRPICSATGWLLQGAAQCYPRRLLTPANLIAAFQQSPRRCGR
jgi:long-chain acyl-CoA synthetase